MLRCLQGSFRYFLGIFLVFVAPIDSQNDVKNREGNDSEVHRFILQKISIGKDITPVDRFG